MTVKTLRQTYQIKITLVGSKPPIWRRLHVPSSINLAKLHGVLQITMGWLDYHLHEFQTKYARYAVLDEEFGLDDVEDETKYKLSDLLQDEKDYLQYSYDFGDGWEHKVILEKVSPFNPKEPAISCIAGKRTCPPEDCGGIWGYANLLEAISDPKHSEHENMLEWIGGDFDPELFDPEQVNEVLHG